MNNEEIIGHWRSKAFPVDTFGDSKVIILDVPDREKATLWVQEEDKDLTLALGQVTILEIDNESFKINFNGNVIHYKYNSISSYSHSKFKPESFIINLPDYGERYMEKIK